MTFEIRFDWHVCWIGFVWRRLIHVNRKTGKWMHCVTLYVCLLPFLPMRLEWERGHYDGDPIHSASGARRAA